ncbi:MAG: NOL1/NOP2/sun family putative RNA methylase [Candidatus Jordarchaeum sp.]|uniref:NOL1/NOP2/sun family putative RNA methylase n=1 Tax=Candidatus Jordarchaeum sp. TaxID=2823881 RepID=UPI00404B76CD
MSPKNFSSSQQKAAVPQNYSKENLDELRKLNPEFFERYEEIDCSKSFLEYMLKPLRQSIRVNVLKVSGKDVLENLGKNFDFKPVPWCTEGYFIYPKRGFSEVIISNTIEYQLGLIFVQEASSMIPPVVLEVKPGQFVLDMAAAPGGKTTHIGMYMKNKGCLIANDIKKNRLNILILNIQRSGILNAWVTGKDGRFFKRFENRFDRVLLDAPCSNVGMIRKNFKYLKVWRKNIVESQSRLQKEMILAGYQALKPEGIMVYSTCTLEPPENEEVIDYLVSKTNANVIETNLPLRKTKPFTEFEGKKFDNQVKKCLRIHPQDNDTEGFFVAKIVKED